MAGWIEGTLRTDRRRATLGRGHRRCDFRRRTRRWFGVVRVGTRDAAQHDVPVRPRSRHSPTPASQSRQSHHGARGVTRRCTCAARHLLLTGETEQARAMFAESVAVSATTGNTDALVLGQSELALIDMDRGEWAAAAEHLEPALAAIDEYRMHDYVESLLAFAGAARLALHRGDVNEANRQLTQAMRARPVCTFALPYLAVRLRLQLAKVYLGAGRPYDRSPPDARDRRHLAPPSRARRTPRRGRGVPQQSHVERGGGHGRHSTAHPRRAPPAALLADAPHVSRDR